MNPLRYLLWGGLVSSACVGAFGQSTAFLYQGELNANGRAASGSYDFVFSLCDSNGVTAAAVTNAAVPVSNGLFGVSLDFGAVPYGASNFWIQISVRMNGSGNFAALSPMQPVLPVPAATMANKALSLAGALPASQLSGTYPESVIFGNMADQFAGSFAGDGGGLSNVDAATLNGIPGSNYATVDALADFVKLEVLTNYATLDTLTNYAPVGSVSVGTSGSSIPNIVVFDSPGSNQFTVPNGITRLMVEVWGGGGGGATANTGSPTSGGGGGGYGKGVFAITAGTKVSVIVGGGGSAGMAGGASSFGNFISATGGMAGTNVTFLGKGGVGGASTAIINISGGNGQWTTVLGGGYGGNAPNGGQGGYGDAGSGPGNGQIPGGGGGGGAGDPGGSGGHGRVIIYY